MRIIRFLGNQLGLADLSKKIEKNSRMLNELNWADIFNNSIEGCSWLKGQSFSPGRIAAGYPCLFILFKALELTKPKNLLECGLGQTSGILFRYAEEFKDVKVTTLEHDTGWINFFINEMNIPANVEIITVQNVSVSYKGVETLSIKEIEKTVGNSKFDLILIDAPYGSLRYSRSQVLSLIPENIDPDHFILLIDDYDRSGEKETCQEIENLFSINDISNVKGIYSGTKDTVIYCSPDLKFLSTL